MTTMKEKTSREGLTVKEFFAQRRPGQTMTIASNEAGVSYSTIRNFCKGRSKTMSADNARKLERWSKGAISAAKTLRV